MRYGSLALALTAVLGASCCDCVDDPHDTTPNTVAIIPDNLALLKDQTIQLEVRIWDGEGHVVPADPADPPKWHSSDPTKLTEVVATGRFGLFKGAVAGSYVITVEAAGKTATAQLAVTAGVSTASEDLVTAPHTLPTPSYAVIGGSRGASPFIHEQHAFGGAVTLANVTAGLPAMTLPDGTPVPAQPGWVVLFSRPYATGRTEPAWLPAPQAVAFAAFVDDGVDKPDELLPLISIRARVWSATTGEPDEAALLDQLKQANGYLAGASAGIELATDGTVGLLVPRGIMAAECSDPAAVMRLASNPAASPYQEASAELHIVYADYVMLDAYSSVRGLACNPAIDPAKPARVIFMSGVGSASTLGHELGHLFSLFNPNEGHIQCVAGFDQANLMWGGLDDTHATRRSTFTLGQAFRLVLDDWSLVNHGGYRSGVTFKCHTQDAMALLPAGFCPRLAQSWSTATPPLGPTCP